MTPTLASAFALGAVLGAFTLALALAAVVGVWLAGLWSMRP